MLDLDVPGRGRFSLTDLVLDFNGTIALDGELLPGVPERLIALGRLLNVRAWLVFEPEEALRRFSCADRLLYG